MLSKLHQGELKTIRIALQISAAHLLIDDFDAHRAAEEDLLKVSAATTLKSTLWHPGRTISGKVDL
uniref:Uncharacterized protein n=1 Tax=Candidatus Methanogaster sp. ANME-2c ERB4 TaxID=2759911 RepID=A0A7G9YPM9_9EURY|nr:hypothetical protein DBPBNLAN_00034 [Methanosarcinales archaeon ANME-2c ERB4]QNO49963.1 hypothetical protein FNHNGOKL_00031 [Methanosarcinales archaeon ANME-2c ERB4]